VDRMSGEGLWGMHSEPTQPRISPVRLGNNCPDISYNGKENVPKSLLKLLKLRLMVTAGEFISSV
jgi:hypothetical protein